MQDDLKKEEIESLPLDSKIWSVEKCADNGRVQYVNLNLGYKILVHPLIEEAL